MKLDTAKKVIEAYEAVRVELISRFKTECLPLWNSFIDHLPGESHYKGCEIDLKSDVVATTFGMAFVVRLANGEKDHIYFTYSEMFDGRFEHFLKRRIKEIYCG